MRISSKVKESLEIRRRTAQRGNGYKMPGSQNRKKGASAKVASKKGR